jgi:hypothetical protein
MSLQLHSPDGKGGLEARSGTGHNYRSTLRSPRWGAALRGGRLPALANTEMNPTSSARAAVFWAVLALITFAVIVAGYATGVFSLV